MKANPVFDDLSLKWWTLTGASVKQLRFAVWCYSGQLGRWGEYGRTKRRELKELCRARRDVCRAGSAL